MAATRRCRLAAVAVVSAAAAAVLMAASTAAAPPSTGAAMAVAATAAAAPAAATATTLHVRLPLVPSKPAGGFAASSPGAVNVTLMMELNGRVCVMPFDFLVDTVDVAGGADTYRCGGSYADVLATGTVRLGVHAQACDAASSGGSPASFDGVQVSVRDVAGDEGLRVFPQPDGCAAVADAVADGCSHAFTPDGSALLLRPSAYQVGVGVVVASLVWPAAAVDWEAWEAGVSVRQDTTPPPPPFVTVLLVDVEAVALDVYGAELVGVSAFNAVYGGLYLRVRSGVSAVQSADVANVAGRGLRMAFGDGCLAAAAVANGTAFVATSSAARTATLAVAVRLDVYTPTRFSASKAGAVAAALAVAADVATDAVAIVDVGASAAVAAAGAVAQTVYVRVAPAVAAAARSAMTDALASRAPCRWRPAAVPVAAVPPPTRSAACQRWRWG
ncbi:hypothetical protein I4F81_004374 [Pyropia yezoensis]|uniref:Uncharacterized protein n=1 Tax=Pyropia yezoensis TaxID=2788 RepID=A0ACC3BV52_PYRYE|nr:hypothetical protein I4F81_004374 [Neopyropia yezoensis]